jgi:hypothetical protein
MFFPSSPNQWKHHLFCKLVEDSQLTPALPELGTAQPQLVKNLFLYQYKKLFQV